MTAFLWTGRLRVYGRDIRNVLNKKLDTSDPSPSQVSKCHVQDSWQNIALSNYEAPTPSTRPLSILASVLDRTELQTQLVATTD